MPIEIHEVNSTVEVQRGTSAEEAASTHTNTPTPPTEQRWVDIARRQAQLQERTAAWRFDD